MSQYRAFISYRHADNRQQGRQWATWLHQAIETYEIPKELVGTKNSRGEEIPERIFPVFRDEEGAFGTPTSDSVRTCVSKETTRFLMIIIDYGASSLPLATKMAISLLEKYAGATNIEHKNIG